MRSPSYWEYRVVVVDGEAGVHEVYFDNDNAVVGWSESLVPTSDSLDELRVRLQLIGAALEKDPVVVSDGHG